MPVLKKSRTKNRCDKDRAKDNKSFRIAFLQGLQEKFCVLCHEKEISNFYSPKILIILAIYPIIIFNLANSFIFFNKYGIFHLRSKKTATYTLHSEHKIFTEIFLLDVIFYILQERKKYKQFIVFKAYDVFKKIKKHKLSEINKNYLKSILQKIMNYNYINKEDKTLIKKKFSQFIYIEF